MCTTKITHCPTSCGVKSKLVINRRGAGNKGQIQSAIHSYYACLSDCSNTHAVMPLEKSVNP
jgi:hypothetical protein